MRQNMRNISIPKVNILWIKYNRSDDLFLELISSKNYDQLRNRIIGDHNIESSGIYSIDILEGTLKLRKDEIIANSCNIGDVNVNDLPIPTYSVLIIETYIDRYGHTGYHRDSQITIGTLYDILNTYDISLYSSFTGFHCYVIHDNDIIKYVSSFEYILGSWITNKGTSENINKRSLVENVRYLLNNPSSKLDLIIETMNVDQISEEYEIENKYDGSSVTFTCKNVFPSYFDYLGAYEFNPFSHSPEIDDNIDSILGLCTISIMESENYYKILLSKRISTVIKYVTGMTIGEHIIHSCIKDCGYLNVF